MTSQITWFGYTLNAVVSARDARLISTSTKGLFDGKGEEISSKWYDEIRPVTYLKAYLTCKGNTLVNIF